MGVFGTEGVQTVLLLGPVPDTAELTTYHPNLVVSCSDKILQLALLECGVPSHLLQEENQGEGHQGWRKPLERKVEDRSFQEISGQPVVSWD